LMGKEFGYGGLGRHVEGEVGYREEDMKME
jgi:hypothetical protein